jgi:hypothetical protein
MINLKEAVEIVQDYLKTIYPDVQSSLVEEVDMDEAEKFWFITMSFWAKPDVPPLTPVQSSLSAILSPKMDRIYKTFKINAETGKVISMKIRVLAV